MQSPDLKRVFPLLKSQDGLSRQFNVVYLSCEGFIILIIPGITIARQHELARRARYCFNISVCPSSCDFV